MAESGRLIAVVMKVDAAQDGEPADQAHLVGRP
ncbi:MAG: hypothetical protein JWP39_632, partial [Jatrophihabitans sp.]|nr:hypothetical protein [Jatrophihabitans sp.]